MTIISRLALATLAASLFSSVVAVDYKIVVGTPAVTANGFDEATDSAEITMAFTLSDGAGVTSANVACAIYEVATDQCNTAAAITAITVTPTLTGNDLSTAVNVDLASITASNAWSYDAGTKVGTINFCNRCATSDATVEIAYAETLATVTVTMQEDIPASVTATVTETAASAPATSDAGVATYEVTATQCVAATKAADTTVLAQGEALSVCVSFAQAGVDCDHYQTLDLTSTTSGTLSVVAAGAIVNSALTTAGSTSAAPSTDGTCVATTQFPASLIPVDGSAGTVTISGAVVLHFGRRKLRVKFGADEQRALQGNNDEAEVKFEFDAAVQASADAPFEVSAAASGTTAGAALFGAAAALILAA